MHSIPLTSHIIKNSGEFSKVVLIPIPLHKYRFHYRGFNQASIFAHILGKQLKLQVCPNLLVRTKLTVPQVEVKVREKRLKNMEGVFSVNPKFSSELHGKTVLHHQFITDFKVAFILVDDVFTTGATMRSAANVLKRTGASLVWAVTIAR